MIRIVDGVFALCDLSSGEVIGVVERCNETQWGFYPLVEGSPVGASQHVPLRYALAEAMKFKRAS